MTFSITELIRQNTAGQSEGFPVGVPKSWNWYQGWSEGGLHTPPATYTAVEGWGAVYQKEGEPAYSSPNADIQVANSKTYVHIAQTGQWVLVQDQSQLKLAGGHFVTDFAGNAGYPMQVSQLPGGVSSFDCPPSGYTDHFWYGSRGTYAAGTVDGVYVQMDMKVTDPNLNLVAIVGADWWRDANAPYLQDHSNNPGIGSSNWIELTTDWKTIGYTSMTPAQIQANPPPPLLGSAQTPPVTGSTDNLAPAAPTIVSFTPDTGTVGDRITSASVVTLTGTAEAGSTVKVFDGATQISTARATAGGDWSVATAQLSSGTHNFTARAADAAGNVSPASSSLPLSVTGSVAPVTSPPVTSPPAAGANLLVNGSFEASSVAEGRWAQFSSVPGWNAVSGGTIELWNNLNNVKATDGGNFGELDYLGARDGLYQEVKTVAGQGYDLSFDARARPGFTASTSSVEVLWNSSVVGVVPPGNTWQTYDFSVVGTGAQDRLTFRELAGQGGDGLGALYDNVALTAKTSPAVTSPPVTSPVVTSPPLTPPAADASLLVNGSFEASSVAEGRWAQFSSVPGWNAISGGTIELWNNLNNVKATDGGNFGELDYLGARDGLYQEVKTVAGQSYDLSFDAQARPGFTASTSSVEVLWNNSVVGVVPPGNTWQTYDFSVVGTGGQDRLTFRELAGQGGDGLGALYDNVALTPKSTSAAPAATVTSADRSIDLMRQYAATSLVSTGSGSSSPLAGASASVSPDQTLALPLH